MWQNIIRANKTTEVPYTYTPSEDNPLVLVPDPKMARWVEEAMNGVDVSHNSGQL